MASGTWTQTTGGNWNLATTVPWSGGIVADAATFTATFSSNITATTTVTVTENRTIGNLTFSDNGASGSAWTLANSGGAVLTLDNSASAPVITTTTAATISGVLAGTSGFTKTGAAELTLTNTGNTITTSGATKISVSQSSLNLGTPTAAANNNANVLPSGVTSIDIASGSNLRYAHTINSPVSVDAIFTGTGSVLIEYGINTWTGAGITFKAGALVGLGPATPSLGGGGLTFGFNETQYRSAQIVTVHDFPTTVSYYDGIGASSAYLPAQTIIKTAGSATGGTYSTKFFINAQVNVASSSNWTNKIEANQSSTGSNRYKLTGGLARVDSTSANTMTFTFGGSNTDDNEFSGAITQTSATYPVAITKVDAGRWVLSGANTYTGTTTISAGTLAGNSTSAFGVSTGTTSVITQTGGTLEFGAVVNKGTNGVTLNSVGGADAVSSPTGTTGLSCAGVALSAASTIFNIAGGTFTLTNTAAMSGGGFGLTKTGAGEMVVASTVANTYTGATTVSAGTLTIQGAVATSSNGPLGNAATGIALTGTLKYAGTGSATISRSLTLTGAAPALEAEGTTSAASVTFSAFTHAAGARTLTLKGSNTGNNTFSAVLNDNGASVVSLTKTGASKWIISAQPTYTGLTTVSAGELQFSELNLSNNLTINGTGKLSKTVLNGSSKTITCDGGTPEIEATTSANTVTGTTAVTGGTLRLTTEVQASGAPVKVLGATAVTVSSGAAIRTTTGILQRGQMRYGGNLTFNANSTLYVGG